MGYIIIRKGLVQEKYGLIAFLTKALNKTSQVTLRKTVKLWERVMCLGFYTHINNKTFFLFTLTKDRKSVPNC